MTTLSDVVRQVETVVYDEDVPADPGELVVMQKILMTIQMYHTGQPGSDDACPERRICGQKYRSPQLPASAPSRLRTPSPHEGGTKAGSTTAEHNPFRLFPDAVFDLLRRDMHRPVTGRRGLTGA